ncbi:MULTISPECIES: hypothetical protein [unclassified Mycoplasma]|uniref:hypothetical protein n=1 Tax=unclassified Mycoplasma TaxID=2683645 RepID=UPI000FDDC6BD
MKRITFNRDKYGTLDFLMALFVLLVHCLAFAFYLALVLSLYFLFYGDFNLSPAKWITLLAYPLSLGVFFNATLQIIYSEIGGLWIRMSMWLHTFILAGLIAVIVFVVN